MVVELLTLTSRAKRAVAETWDGDGDGDEAMGWLSTSDPE